MAFVGPTVISRSLRLGEGIKSIYTSCGIESCKGVGFKGLGSVDLNIARVAKCIWEVEVTGISRRGLNMACRLRRITRISLGKTTNKVAGIVLVLDTGAMVGG